MTLTKAIQCSNNSMYGPDGIPYRVWRKLGDFGISIIYDVAVQISALDFDDTKHRLRDELNSGDADSTATFNDGTLACLPKKPSGVDGEVGEFYSPEDTRPLTIVNTDNRLVANAWRYLLEPLLSPVISAAQRGLLLTLISKL